MFCSCGDTMTVDAHSEKQAANKLKGMMTLAMVKLHFENRHPDMAIPSQKEVHDMIDQKMEAVTI